MISLVAMKFLVMLTALSLVGMYGFYATKKIIDKKKYKEREKIIFEKREEIKDEKDKLNFLVVPGL